MFVHSHALCFELCRAADECQVKAGEFTCGQIERMHKQWILYRDQTFTCPAGEMEIEFTLEFDSDHASQNSVTLIKDKGSPFEEVVFNSTVDHDDGVFQLQGVMVIDLCVPADSNYEWMIMDSLGNGFSDANAEAVVYQNGVLLDSVTGAFGTSYTVQIPALINEPPGTHVKAPKASKVYYDAQMPTFDKITKSSKRHKSSKANSSSKSNTYTRFLTSNRHTR